MTDIYDPIATALDMAPIQFNPDDSRTVPFHGNMSWNKGKTLSEDHKRAISEAKTGVPIGSTWNKGIPHTDETKQKMSITKTGMKYSDHHRQRISEGLRGHKISEETKRKISETKRLMSGSKSLPQISANCLPSSQEHQP